MPIVGPPLVRVEFSSCRVCGKKIPVPPPELTGTRDSLCGSCAEAAKSLPAAGSYEVFVYSIPWNEYLRRNCSGKQWLPPYQADTGSRSIDRDVGRDRLPDATVFALIKVAVFQHGSPAYFKVPALVAIREDTGYWCAYIPNEEWRRRSRGI